MTRAECRRVSPSYKKTLDISTASTVSGFVAGLVAGIVSWIVLEPFMDDMGRSTMLQTFISSSLTFGAVGGLISGMAGQGIFSLLLASAETQEITRLIIARTLG